MTKQMPFFLAIFSLVIIGWNCFINIYFTRQNTRCLKLANNIENIYANLHDRIERKAAERDRLQQEIDDAKIIQAASKLANREALYERFEELKEEQEFLEIQRDREVKKKTERQLKYGKELKGFVKKLLGDKEILLKDIDTVKKQLKKIKEVAG